MATYKVVFKTSTVKTGYVIADSPEEAIGKIQYPHETDDDGNISGRWSAGEGPGWDAVSEVISESGAESITDLNEPDTVIDVTQGIKPENW